MRISQICEELEAADKVAKRYLFTVYADGREVLRDVEMRWRITPRAALPKFAAMMKRKYRGRELDISMDWS